MRKEQKGSVLDPYLKQQSLWNQNQLQNRVSCGSPTQQSGGRTIILAFPAAPVFSRVLGCYVFCQGQVTFLWKETKHTYN